MSERQERYGEALGMFPVSTVGREIHSFADGHVIAFDKPSPDTPNWAGALFHRNGDVGITSGFPNKQAVIEDVQRFLEQGCWQCEQGGSSA